MLLSERKIRSIIREEIDRLREQDGSTTSQDGSTQAKPTTTQSPMTISMPPSGDMAGPPQPLTTDDDIRKYIGRQLSAYGTQIRSSYESILKQDPELNGTWTLSLTIKQDGTTSDVKLMRTPSVTGGDKSIAAFETDVVSKAKAWRFYKLSEDLPIEKNYNLRPQSY